jgi:predicted AlkP superfamily phosphohydrolase/phosphomutase
MLVGFPGMEASLLDRWTADGTMPVFAELQRRGRSFALGNRLDHLPDTIWPEIYTGRMGHELGWYRLPTQLFSGETEPREVRPGDVDLTAVWDHASRAGRVVAAVDVPYSSSSRDIKGLLLRGWGTHDKPFGTATDPDPTVLDDLVGRFGAYPLSHIHAEHTRCDDQNDTVESYRWLRNGLLEGGETKGRLFRHVLDQRDWDLFLCGFEEAHCAGHQFWHHNEPTARWHDPEAPEDVKNTLRDVYIKLDDMLGHVLEGAGDDSAVLVLLSHGMQLAGGGWHVLGEVLVRLGYGSGSTAVGKVRGRIPAPVKAAIRAALPGRTRARLQQVAGSLPSPLESSETRAVALLNSPCGAVRLNVKGRDPYGAVEPGAEYESACDELEYELGRLVDARSGLPAVQRIVVTHRHYGDSVHPNLPDLLLSFNGEVAPIEGVSSPRIGTITAPLRTALLPRSGDHTQTSRLIWTGPTVEPGGLEPVGDVVDVAATLLDHVDVPVPETLDGTPLQLQTRGVRPEPLAEASP